MTAQKDKQPEGGKGRSGDIQARQADDGSFELVVENSADSGSSATPDSQGASQATEGEARPSKAGTGGAKRLGAIVVVGLVGVGALVYALSGDGGDAPSDAARVEAGFRPYLGGPGEEGSSAPPASSRSTDEQSDEDQLDDGSKAQASQVAGDSEAPDEVEEWEPEEDGEVVVIEEEHPPEEFEDVDEADEIDKQAVEKPDIDTSQIPRFKERLRLPIESPKIKHLPSPQLNKLQPRLPQNRDEPAAGDEAYLDDQEQLEDEGYADEGYEGDGLEGGEGEAEYDDQDEGFEEYDEGY